MYPHLFGIDVLNMYGLCIGIGVIACLMFLRFACKRLNIPQKFEDFCEINAILSVAVGILSGMLFQSFYIYLDDPSKGFHFTTDITFLGGLLGGAALFLLIYFLYGRKKYGAYLIRLLPIAACCIAVAHAFGRIGCFCYGCCYGREAEPHAFLAVNFPGSGWRYPTQLFESFFLFALFFGCAYLTVFKKYKYTMNVYLITYGIFRFIMEFFRDDYRASFIPGLTPSQFWSLVMIVLGIALYFILPYLFKKFNIKLDDISDTQNSEVVNEQEQPNGE